jgi:hypothetical protein
MIQRMMLLIGYILFQETLQSWYGPTFLPSRGSNQVS